MNSIVWPEGYMPGETDNYVSNVVILPKLSAEQIWPYLNDISQCVLVLPPSAFRLKPKLTLDLDYTQKLTDNNEHSQRPDTMDKQTVKVVKFYETGDSSVLKLEDTPIREPEAQQVRIKVEAIGLNRAEVMFREGQYLEAPELPSQLGYEAAGIVDAIGDGVTDLQVGDRVSTVPAFSMGEFGVYGESAIVPAYAVAKYPDNLSSVEGAAIWMQYITAYGALIDLGQLSKGETVLITAASSSVGLAAIQLAKSVGALTIATTRGADKKSFLLEAGADHVIQTDSENLVDRVQQITSGVGANLIFDPVAGPLLEDLASAAAQGATVIEYGSLAGAATPFPLFSALSKGLTFRGYTLFELTQDIERLSQATAFIFPRLQKGDLKPIVDCTFALADIRKAHDYMESNQQKGKIVVTV
jgi:NADPH:quinone reductase